MVDVKEEVLEETVEEEETVEAEDPETEQKDELAEAQQKIEELEAMVASLKNDYARAYADTQNIKKRLQAEYDNAKIVFRNSLWIYCR